MIGRRAFLIGGAGVAAIGATSGVALLAPFGPLKGRKWLTETEAAAALALAHTLFHESEGPTPEQADVLGRLDQAVGDLHPDTRRLFKTGLRALEYAPLPRFLSRFSRLDDKARIACVKGWERKPYLWAAALLSMRFQIGMAYFESDEARAACGWALGCTPSKAEN
ncbi:MAG: hypothetical protein ACXWLM_01775 [Myxococcales bacterium]